MRREFPIASTNDEATSSSGRPIIVVDDEPMILDLVCRVLKAAGFTVLTAGSGAAALQLLEHTPAALIITDLMMPQLNGIELARRLRADPATAAIPIVLMSAALPTNIDNIFTAVIHKPFPISQIVQVVRQYVPS